MKQMTTLATAISLALISSTALAATAKVEFKNPDDYRDIEAVNERQSSFQEQLFAGLTEHFEMLAAKLPEGNTLSITVTDLDITGRVEPTYGQGGAAYMRIVDRIDYPRIEFNYQYSDSSGAVLSEESVNLRDLGAHQTMRAAKESGRDELYYEKELLNDWFRDTFERTN
ncbi:MAG TPA: DUF3016 domain-containing protein [Pseudidiomarina sp.]|nr:DUF3016 domain-containing protein [Pseudidiomarina sp.]